MANLKESGAYPDNGVLYVSTEDSGNNQGAVRLTDGAELPKSPTASGFTVATDDPLYIKGDYNTVNKTLSLVAGDAINILSNSWNDANSANSGSPYSNRNASNTTINAVCMNGIVPSDGTYSGGVENFFRLLENWGSKKLTFSGSIIVLWKSKKAVGKWFYGSPVYAAPQRVWSWDAALGGMTGPPGIPPVIFPEKKQWKVDTASD